MSPALRAQPPSDESIRAVAAALGRGGVAVFPTETVYGVGADIRNPDAVGRVFAAKRRAAGRPLMAHCSDESQLGALVADIPGAARAIMREFWPGPLALIFRRAAAVPDVVTGGIDTIGVRMVAHPVGRALIRALGAPIAGTSANIHGEPATGRFDGISPALLAGVDAALDAGVCGAGTASTVIDVTFWPPRLVRPGAVPVPAIEQVIGGTIG